MVKIDKHIAERIIFWFIFTDHKNGSIEEDDEKFIDDLVEEFNLEDYFQRNVQYFKYISIYNE